MGDGRKGVARWVKDGEECGVLCSPCYHRWRKYGNPAEPPRRSPNGKGRYRNQQGYIEVAEIDADGKIITHLSENGRVRTTLRKEHRVVMERVLGRPLEPFEDVHHRNGVKDDNRPENLELWCSQPRGQRVEDLVAFVVGQYPGLVAEALRMRAGVIG